MNKKSFSTIFTLLFTISLLAQSEKRNDIPFSHTHVSFGDSPDAGFDRSFENWEFKSVYDIISNSTKYVQNDYILKLDCKAYVGKFPNRGSNSRFMVVYGEYTTLDFGKYTGTIIFEDDQGYQDDWPYQAYSNIENFESALGVIFVKKMDNARCNSANVWARKIQFKDSRKIDWIRISMTSGDAFWLDRVELRSFYYDGGSGKTQAGRTPYGAWGADKKKGYCFSTEPSDANGGFKEHIGKRGCAPCWLFDVKDGKVKPCENDWVMAIDKE